MIVCPTDNHVCLGCSLDCPVYHVCFVCSLDCPVHHARDLDPDYDPDYGPAYTYDPYASFVDPDMEVIIL